MPLSPIARKVFAVSPIRKLLPFAMNLKSFVAPNVSGAVLPKNNPAIFPTPAAGFPTTSPTVVGYKYAHASVQETDVPLAMVPSAEYRSSIAF